MHPAVMRIRNLPVWAVAVALAAVPRSLPAGDAKGGKEPQPVKAVVVPQVGVLGNAGTNRTARRLKLSRVDAQVHVIDAASKTGQAITADTELKLRLQPTGKAALSCEVVVPVPTGARQPRFEEAPSVRAKYSGKLSTLQTGTSNTAVLPNDASRVYCRNATAQSRQPSLLEFYGYDFVKTPAVQLAPGKPQSVGVRYRQKLSAQDNRVDFLIPKSELLSYRVPWSISATIRSKRRIATVYSPSHPIRWKRDARSGDVAVAVQGNATVEPGPFRLSWLYETGGVSGSVVAFPPREGRDGYFLLLLAVTENVPKTEVPRREVTVVLDRSASTAGKRLNELRGITGTVLDDLRPGEKFNIVAYNSTVDTFRHAPVSNTAQTVNAAKTYLKRLDARGGSNIHDALKTSLAQPASSGFVPIVLFFTDGLPTSGTTEERAIGKLVETANTAGRRVYTFALGVDLNSPLLQRIANDTRGEATYVLPAEEISRKVGPVLRQLQYPVLTDPRLSVASEGPAKQAAAIHHVIPHRLPDLFAGQRLLVVGRYRGSRPIRLQLSGKYLGKPKSFTFAIDPRQASTEHRYLPRLWAGRRIAELIESIRQSGASLKPPYAVRTQRTNPKLPAWSKEILELTAEHGVITEYTAFLTSNTGRWGIHQSDVYQQALANFASRAQRTRGGYGAVNQEFNGNAMKGQSRLNPRNRYLDNNMAPVQTNGVQQIGNSTYFLQGATWVDGRLLKQRRVPSAQKTVRFGTPGYNALLKRLARSGDQGALGLDRAVLMQQDKKAVLVVPPSAASRAKR